MCIILFNLVVLFIQFIAASVSTAIILADIMRIIIKNKNLRLKMEQE
ncbi:hypothetical protein CDLVIII_4885 [Clostridium sp. DL-VIII]|nr:hypothetical protein CDLVIII_4885 [Clostridium sp. DL-VIII]